MEWFRCLWVSGVKVECGRDSFIRTPWERSDIMPDDSEDEDNDSSEVSQEEWNAFWRSLNRYKTPDALRREVFRQADEIWADVSPRYTSSEHAYVAIQDGQFRANMAGHVFVTAMANAVFRTTLNTIFRDEVLAELSEELQAQVADTEPVSGQQLRPEQECPACGEVFDPGMSTCPNCGEEL